MFPRLFHAKIVLVGNNPARHRKKSPRSCIYGTKGLQGLFLPEKKQRTP
jgi:hypothetical protein